MELFLSLIHYFHPGAPIVNRGPPIFFVSHFKKCCGLIFFPASIARPTNFQQEKKILGISKM